ncbi:hypothetical protein FSP39_001120 [Pinctada imbricata]|uniref:CUB domain-containing protein n=1 Tax=Pinctada imbricata TaxID=66713 RepID=A0AA88XEQ5_PINIB|nr:hypothetical protein FSP39_001120 [Pinctada imbricata]
MSPVGNITSPGYPHGYSPNKHCEWRISVGQGHGVRFKVITFDLHPEVDGFCRHGYLQVGSMNRKGYVTDTNLTLLAMLLLLVPIILPLSIYCYIKRLRNRALDEPEQEIYHRFKKKHYKKKKFSSTNEHNIQITVDPPSEDDEQKENRTKDKIRPSGNYENYKSSDAELDSLEVTTDISNTVENESVFRQETPNFDQLFIVADRAGSISGKVNLLSSTPFDNQQNRLYVSLLGDSGSLDSKKKQNLLSTRASTGQIMSATSVKTKNGQPVLVLKEICKAQKYRNFLSIEDMADIYETKKEKRKNTHGSKSGFKVKSPSRTKLKSVSSRKNSAIPKNDRVESLRSNERSIRDGNVSRKPKYERRSYSYGLSTLTVPTPQKRKFSLPEKASTRKERLPSKILSSIRRSSSSTPAVPEPDYNSEPSSFHSAYYSARSQYDGHFFHEQSPVDEEQLWMLSECPKTSPLQRCFSDRFVGVVGNHNSSMSVSRYHRRRSAAPCDKSLHDIRENYSTPSYHCLPRINKDNLTSSLQYTEGSTVLAGNIGSTSNEPKNTEKISTIPEIHITGASEDNSIQGNDKCSIVESHMDTTTGIDNLAFESSELESPPQKIYNKEEIDEIYNSRSSLRKRGLKLDENNNKNIMESGMSWTVPNEFCPDSVIVLQQGESMV